MKTEDTRALVTRFMEYMGAGNSDGFLELYHPDATVWTAGETMISGTTDLPKLREFSQSVLGAFPEGIKFRVTGMTVEGDRAAVEAESEGLHVSGKAYSNQYHFLFKCKDGKVLQLKEYMDTERVTDVICGGQRPQGKA